MNVRAWRAVLLLELVGSGVAAPMLAQDDYQVIPDPLACPTCVIDHAESVSLGAGDGPGMLDWRGGQAFAAIDSRGLIYLRGYFSTEIKVYSSEGKYLATIGREGEGPGEFRGVMGLAVDASDSLFVFDSRNMRLSVFGPDHVFARAAPLTVQPPGVDPRVIEGDSQFFYMTAHVRTPDLIGLPIHKIDRSGVRVASFGSESGGYSPEEPFSGMRVLAPEETGGLWSGRVAHYSIEKLAPVSHEVLLTIRRDAGLFPDPERGQGVGGHSDEPQAFLTDLWQDSDRLWVLSWAVDPKWKTASSELEEEHLRFDSVIEVLDLVSWRVLARLRVDELYHQFLPGGRIGGTVFEGGLIPIYRIMNLRLRGEGQR